MVSVNYYLSQGSGKSARGALEAVPVSCSLQTKSCCLFVPGFAGEDCKLSVVKSHLTSR